MKRAAIVGSGIGGLATAIALRKIGFDIQVYERSATLREVGSGLSLWPNAVRCLEEIDPGVLKTLKTKSSTLLRLLMKDASGNEVKTIRFPGTDPTGIAVLRADLQNSLAEVLPSNLIHLNHTFARLENRGNSVVLHFENGASEPFDLVVGCDGIHSAVRRSLDLASSLTSQPYSVWRGMTRIRPSTDIQCLGLDREGDFSESYGWGQRFGILRLGPGYVHWYAVANNSLRPANLGDTEALLHLFSGWHSPVPHLISAAESILLTRVQDRSLSLPWGRGQVVTLGDAAHPISPNFGQGAGLAIEDAVVLAASLRSTSEISVALRRYERLRHRRCREVSFTSREAGRFAQMENRVLVSLRKQFIKIAPPTFTTFWFRRSCNFRPPSLATG